MRWWFTSIGRALASVACLVGCGDDGGNAGGNAGGGAGSGAGGAAVAPVSYAGEIQPLVEIACNCHTSPDYMTLGAPFSLEASVAYANLVMAPSQQVPSMQLVVPGSLNQSYLWLKVTGTQAEVTGGGGQIMPPNVPLTDAERDLVGRWIASGAQP